MTNEQPLAGCRIAIPEARQLDLFRTMLEQCGAEVQSCPLVAIHDAPDASPVTAWLDDFSAGNHDDLILLTGEGVRRLLGSAERAGGGLVERFKAALAQVRTVTRGPKPARELRAIGLRTSLPAAAPTTDGIIETFSGHDLRGRVMGVQLYGTDPNHKLMQFLAHAGADARPVAPYVYADAAESARVVALIESLVEHSVDAIAFTSSAQVRRLFSVARKQNTEADLRAALGRTVVAAVGPLTAATLWDHGVTVELVPETSYFMKPLVRALVARLSA